MDKLAFIFPGQGSQYIGMGKTLYEEFEVAKQTFDEANDVLGYDIKGLCFEGSLFELNKTENMLPAIFTVSVASFMVYMKEIGIPPELTAGHSLGEYSALACSGAIDFSDALKLVHIRSLLAREVAETGLGAMTIINGAFREVVENICRSCSNEEQPVSISCYNSIDQIAISGHQEAVMRVEDKLMEIDAQITPLLMSPPFHCPLMESAASKLEGELAKYRFKQFSWPVLSNVTALPYNGPEKIAKNLVMQMTHPVQWQAIMQYIQEKDVKTVVEMGPQAVLSNLLKHNHKNMQTYSFGQEDDRKVMIEKFTESRKVKEGAGAVQRIAPTVVTRCLAIAVCTRNINWDNDEYQKGVVEPYEKIEKMQEQLEQEGAQATVEQMQEALDMLKSVFITKKAPEDLQAKRFKQILEETGTQELLGGYLGIIA